MTNGFAVTPQQQKTLFDNVKPQLALPLFTADLKHQANGSYEFGAIDASKYSGTLAYVPVDSSSFYWGVQITGYSAGGDGTGLTPTTLTSIVDTGTTEILLPKSLVKEYWNKVPSADYNHMLEAYVFDCTEQLPSFYVGFPGYTANVNADLINQGPADNEGKSKMNHDFCERT